MKTKLISFLIMGLLFVSVRSRGGEITDTFEAGENTSDWGSAGWSAGTVTNAFLSPALGGLVAGDNGGSGTQNFSRSFRNNTAGISMTSLYYISMYIEVNADTPPANNDFEIIDGAYGSAAADLLVGPGFQWQAESNGVAQSFGMSLTLNTPYRVEIAVDPTSDTYSSTIQQVDTSGDVLASASLANLSFSPNVINNGQNGSLLFYIQTSGGTVDTEVDNITINNTGFDPVPEPPVEALAICCLVLPLLKRMARKNFLHCRAKGTK